MQHPIWETTTNSNRQQRDELNDMGGGGPMGNHSANLVPCLSSSHLEAHMYFKDPRTPAVKPPIPTLLNLMVSITLTKNPSFMKLQCGL